MVCQGAAPNPRGAPLTRTTTLVLASLLTFVTFAQAQDPPPPTPTPTPAPDPAPPPVPPTNAELDARVRALEADLAAARAGGVDHGDDDWECEECDDDDDDHQFQLRTGWFNLQHNHHDELRKNDGHQNGWAFGAGIVLKLWDFNEDDAGHPGRHHDDRDRGISDDSDRDGFDDDHDGQVDEDHQHHDHKAIDLCAYMTLEYRQIEGDGHYRSVIDGSEGTISYLNAVVAPMIRFEATELVRPFFMIGANMQVASPADDQDSHLDLGLLLGVGLDLRVHEHVSLGMDYRYTWFGVADQDDEDYGQLSAYIGFNF